MKHKYSKKVMKHKYSKKVMKHKYSKKQIVEAIKYWENKLKTINESSELGGIVETIQPENAVAIIIIVPKTGLNHSNIEICPVDAHNLEYFLTTTEDINPETRATLGWSVFEEDYPDSIFTFETNKEIVKIIPIKDKLV